MHVITGSLKRRLHWVRAIASRLITVMFITVCLCCYLDHQTMSVYFTWFAYYVWFVIDIILRYTSIGVACRPTYYTCRCCLKLLVTAISMFYNLSPRASQNKWHLIKAVFTQWHISHIFRIPASRYGCLFYSPSYAY